MFTRETPGMTRANLSRDPLMTEGEATPGDDGWNPFDDENVDERAMRELDLTGYSPAESKDFEFEPHLPEF